MKPFISILTVTHNRGQTFLADTLASVKQQVTEGFSYEHIVVNNASTDTTKQLLADCSAADPQLLVINSDSNDGPATALNKALAIAKGDFILPLDDDDLLMPFSLQIYHQAHQQNTAIDLAFGYPLFIDEYGRVLSEQRTSKLDFPATNQQFVQQMIETNMLTNSAVIARHSLVSRVGGWDDGEPCHDWKMWIKLLRAGAQSASVNSYVSMYRVHANSLTTLRVKQDTYRTEKIAMRRKYHDYINNR